MAITINQETIAFYHELGVAISQWSHVERALGDIAIFCFARDPATFTFEQYADQYVAFFSIENFRAKIQYADALFQRRYGETDHAVDWKSLVAGLGKRVRMRNNFAHFPALGTLDGPDGKRWCIASRQIDLSPTRYPEGALFLQDIVQHRLKFFALMVRLKNFFCRLRGIEELFPKSSEQPLDLPTNQQIVDRILSTLGRPPPPSGV